MLTADKGKTPVVQEDPITEAVRRAIMGGGHLIVEEKRAMPLFVTLFEN